MLFQRVLTVVLLAPFLIGAILVPSPIVFQGVVILCIAFALREFFTIAGFPKMERLFGMGLGVFHSLFLLFCPERAHFLLLELSLLMAVLFAFYVVLPINVGEEARRLPLSLLGILYIGSFGSLVGLIRDLPDGVFWIFVILAMTWLNDTAAYFIGHRFGRRRMAPLLSPGKTWEGFFGGFLGSLVGFYLFWFLFRRPLPATDGLILTLLVGLAGPLGDLAESLIKRGFGVKDSGQMIPGHGGMLDRVDALLFVAPVVYFYATL